MIEQLGEAVIGLRDNPFIVGLQIIIPVIILSVAFVVALFAEVFGKK